MLTIHIALLTIVKRYSQVNWLHKHHHSYAHTFMLNTLLIFDTITHAAACMSLLLLSAE